MTTNPLAKKLYAQNLYKQQDNVNQVKQELEHIRSPYSLEEILDLYCKGSYNAELLLQHSLKILINNNFKYDETENTKI